jgi:hypothetical protein
LRPHSVSTRVHGLQYEKARPGTFKLIPAGAHLAELRSDYRDMTMMIFGEIPAFDAIVDALQQLEDEINERGE